MAVSYSEQMESAAYQYRVEVAVRKVLHNRRLRASDIVEALDPYCLLPPGISSILWGMVDKKLLVWNTDGTLSLPEIGVSSGYRNC